MAALEYTAADRQALERLQRANPAWTGTAVARDVLPLAERVILHAGPPVSPTSVPAPMLNSAAMAVIFEGWATDFASASRLIRSGEVRLRPAQDVNVVVPLAAVLSPGMTVQIVADQEDRRRVAYAPLNGGSGPAMRLGLAGPEVVDHLCWLNGEFAAVMRTAFGEPVPLIPIADAALAAGDDCHGRTAAATRQLLEMLRRRLPTTPAGERAGRFLEQGSSFFLNLWMAASKCIAEAGRDRDSSVVTACGGNGFEIGLQLGGLPDRWFTAPAQPPHGRIEPSLAQEQPLAAIGDSALIDILGLGAMAMSFAPEQAKALGEFMPETADQLARKLLFAPHPRFTATRPLFGLAARRVAELRTGPAIALGMLDRAGRKGRIGGGIFAPSWELFAAACQALEAAH